MGNISRLCHVTHVAARNWVARHFEPFFDRCQQFRCSRGHGSPCFACPLPYSSVGWVKWLVSRVAALFALWAKMIYRRKTRHRPKECSIEGYPLLTSSSSLCLPHVCGETTFPPRFCICSLLRKAMWYSKKNGTENKSATHMFSHAILLLRSGHIKGPQPFTVWENNVGSTFFLIIMFLYKL